MVSFPLIRVRVMPWFLVMWLSIIRDFHVAPGVSSSSIKCNSPGVDQSCGFSLYALTVAAKRKFFPFRFRISHRWAKGKCNARLVFQSPFILLCIKSPASSPINGGNKPMMLTNRSGLPGTGIKLIIPPGEPETWLVFPVLISWR